MNSNNHINILKKRTCCGCNACKEICPKTCIEMSPDEFGVLYPHVDEKNCIQCGKCIRICPFINSFSQILPIQCFAAINKNGEERQNSSSGGVFIKLARHYINKGGVVCGAAFTNDWKLEHKIVNTLKETCHLMGSKYIQSSTLNMFTKIKDYLLENVDVLFTGTPCQIAGLQHFLQKEFSNLLCVEVICHGAPAPKIWESYLTELSQKQSHTLSDITSISFRNKSNGWKDYKFKMTFLPSSEDNTLNTKNKSKTYIEPYTQNLYMKAFLSDLSLRPSCYDCKAKDGKSHTDITMGDFWGVNNTIIYDDDKGISCVICRTEKGLKILKSIDNLDLTVVNYDSILKGNPSLVKSPQINLDTKLFKKKFPKYGFYKTMYKIENPTFIIKIYRLGIRIRNKILRMMS